MLLPTLACFVLRISACLTSVVLSAAEFHNGSKEKAELAPESSKFFLTFQVDT